MIIAEKICRVFGYSIDVNGLVDWANSNTARLADYSDREDLRAAQRRMTGAILSEYWFVRDRYAFGFEFGNGGRFYTTSRFRMRYQKKCAQLAKSPDAGVFFTKTSEEEGFSEMVCKVRVNFMRAAVPRPAVPGKRRPIGDVRIPQ